MSQPDHQSTTSPSPDCSTLQIRSNLMVDSEDREPHLRWLPGDFLALVYREYRDRRNWQRVRPEQKIEIEQYLVCRLCGKPCAGLCRE